MRIALLLVMLKVADYTDSLAKLRFFKKPVLLLTGKGTVAVHRRINRLLEKEFPNTTSKEIAGGHSAPQVAVKDFILAIQAFIQ